MNGLMDKSQEDRGTLVVSLRKTLESLLSQLNKPTNSETFDENKNNDAGSILHSYKEVDEPIQEFLSFVGSKFSLWIFDDLMNSHALQTELWVSFFYPAVNKYRTDVVGKYKDDTQQTPVAASQAAKRFDKVCKHVSHFYAQFVAQVIETFGFTPQLHYAVSVLHLKLTARSRSAPTNANEKLVPAIHLLVHDALCHLGDLSRYRVSNGSNKSASTQQDFSHALVYYTTAFKIQPSSGMPLNQLGNISYSTGDIFSGTFYFLRSVAVDDPFKDGSANLKIILKKLLKIKDSVLSEVAIAGIESKEELATSVKANLMRILQLYSNYYMSQFPNTKQHNHSLSATLQVELTDRLFDLLKTGSVPSEILVKLAITSITFVWLHEKVCESDGSAKSLDAYTSSLELTLRLFDKILAAVLHHEESTELQPSVRAFVPAIRVYLDWINKQLVDISFSKWRISSSLYTPLFQRITDVLELLRKADGFKFEILTAVARSNWDHFEDVLRQQDEDSSDSDSEDDDNEDSQHGRVRAALYENDEETQCLGLLPVHGGLDDTPSGLAASARGQKASQDIYRAQCALFSGVEISRLPMTFLKLDEFGTDTGGFTFMEMEIDAVPAVAAAALQSFDLQDEVSSDGFEEVAVSDHRDSWPTSSSTGTAASVATTSEPMGIIDETELYDSISRSTIPAQLRRGARRGRATHPAGNTSSDFPSYAIPGGPSATTSDHSKRAIELERKQAQFIARPGSSMQSVNASASPQFLRKLRALEHNGGAGGGGGSRRLASSGGGGNFANGGQGQGRGKGKSAPSTPSRDKRQANSNSNGRNGGRTSSVSASASPGMHRVSPPAPAPVPQLGRPQSATWATPVNISTSDSDSDENEESSDEEIVFLGRSRAGR